ncbi:MAG: MFS transporter [Burkholderiales bacterium]|nr:MFS transporter [Burkholderiales bacterium]
MPSAKAHYGLSEGTLALALLAASLGALAILGVAGRLVAHFGAQQVVRGAGLLMTASLGVLLLPTPAAPGTPWVLWALLALFGASSALADVAINAEGAVLEAQAGRKLMSGLHGFFSLGGMLGAVAVAGLLKLQVPAAVQMALLALLLTALLLPASRHMLPAHPPLQAQEGEAATWRRPHGRLALLGLLAALALLAEGAMYDWSVLFLQSQTGATPAFAALGYAAFCGAMAAMRFAGDALRERHPPARLMAAGALLAAAALLLALWLRQPWVGLLAFALVGAGLANGVPLLFVAASQVRGVTPATGIATVTALGFFGFLSGPPLIGALAEAASLSQALGVVVLCCLVLALAARRL